MLSDKIRQLFSLLQCTNTDIAGFSGCTPSNISRLKSGLRDPGGKSKTIRRLAEGIYDYADYEGQLSILNGLLETEKTEKDSLIPLLINWLYDTNESPLPASVQPKSRRLLSQKKKRFGERLNACMELLSLSNAKLAFRMKVDPSLISRYRKSMHIPSRGNMVILKSLTDSLYQEAQKKGKLSSLAELIRLPQQEMSPEALRDWLFSPYEENLHALAEPVLLAMDRYDPSAPVPVSFPALPKIIQKERYFGTAGLRESVIRFLTEAKDQEGELLLYSDEPMVWMNGDRKFFALWASLMADAVQAGVTIKIIHNIDRNPGEMASAIIGWLPLYISGQIEPYEYPKERQSRFFHTLFLHKGSSCISGFFPAGELSESRWYDYIKDKKRLSVLEEQSSSMFAMSHPFLRVFPVSAGWTMKSSAGRKDVRIPLFLTASPLLLCRLKF